VVARHTKERTYPELLGSRRCRLVVLAAEVGGRFSEEAKQFVSLLAKAKARAAPEGLKQATRRAWFARWIALLALTAQRAFAASLLELPLQGTANTEADTPDTSEVLEAAREPPDPSGVA
jgi:hypothetical protein